MKRFLKFSSILLFSLALLGGAAFAILPLPGQFPVLMYHFIGSPADAQASKNYVAQESFQRQMEFLRRFGYRIITLDELYEVKTGQRKPRGREIVITFDDGNVTFASRAFPILKDYQYPVTLFLITERIKNGTEGSMTIPAIQELMKNSWIHIGSHTRTHPILSEIEESQIRRELNGSKIELEQVFNQPIHYLTYPSGNFNSLIGKIAKEAGYRLAFTTSPKKLKKSETGPFAMTRVKISKSSNNPLIFWLKISGIYETFKLLRYESKKEGTF